MTSTYPRPFLPFFPAAPFLPPAVGGPSKSSIELALLILVPGRLGGTVAALPLPVLTFSAEGVPKPPSVGGGGTLPFALLSDGVPSISDEVDAARCGGANPGRGEGVGPESGAPLTFRSGPAPALGGGGVAEGDGVFSAPAFLLTHLFNSGSYTNELASPSFARMGLLGCDISPSFFAPPPNQPLRPHPFLAG
jgi:hypothetical protein